MDFLLVLLSIGGFVFAIVMLDLAARTKRMERESDERVQTLQAMATGSVLFASDEPAGPVELDLAWDGLRDERVEQAPVPAHPFVLTVPATAGQARVFSFDRTQHRSRT